MVAPIRELVNIQISTSALNSKPFQMARILANVAMDINNNFMRKRMNSPNNVRVVKFGSKFFLNFFFLFLLFYFSFLNLGLGFSMMSMAHSHMTMVTSHMVSNRRM